MVKPFLQTNGTLHPLSILKETEGPYCTELPTPDDIRRLLELERVVQWEELIRENVFGLGGHRDRLPACLAHMLYCVVAEEQYNLAYFFVKRIQCARDTPTANLPVMRPLALKQTRRPRSDRGKARHSVSSSSSHHQGTSSHQHDDDDDDVKTSRAKIFIQPHTFIKCCKHFYNNDDGSKPSSDDGKKVDEDPRKESECNNQEKEDNVNNTNNVNASGTNEVNADGGKTSIELPDDPNMPALEDDSIFDYSSDDEDVGAEADMNNLDTTIQVSPIPTTRIHKDHPLDQVIGDLQSATQTRQMSKNLEEHGFEEPKKVIYALKDPSWIEVMREELLQFKLQEVWTLVDLTNGKTAIDSKWVFRNKKNDRGIVIRNKARLVAQGYTQEEEIDYDEAVHKELGDRLVRAATTASSLEAEQDSGGGPRCQNIMGDTIAQTRFENVSKISNDSLLARDKDIALVSAQNVDEQMFDVNDLVGEEVFVAEQEVAANKEDDVVKEVVEVVNTAKLIVDAAQVNTAGNVVSTVGDATTVSAATTTTDDDGKSTTTISSQIPSKQSQDKGKCILVEEPVKHLKKKDQIRLDEETALRLQAEFDEEERLAREKAKKEEANIALTEE
ncbi:putative ribonuclease H-like domain-containing protein [Tanacetum coccineum]